MDIFFFKLKNRKGSEVRSNSIEELSEKDIKNDKSLKKLFDIFNVNTEKVNGNQVLNASEINSVFAALNKYTNRTNQANDGILDEAEAQQFLQEYRVNGEGSKTLSEMNITTDDLFDFLDKFSVKDSAPHFNSGAGDVVMNDGNKVEDIQDPINATAKQRQQIENLTTVKLPSGYLDRATINKFLSLDLEMNTGFYSEKFTDNTVFFNQSTGETLARLIERPNGSKIIEIYEKNENGIVTGTAYYADKYSDKYTTHHKGEPAYTFKEDRKHPSSTTDSNFVRNKSKNDLNYPGIRYYPFSKTIEKTDDKGNSEIYAAQLDENNKPTGGIGHLMSRTVNNFDHNTGSLLEEVTTNYDKNGKIETTQYHNSQTLDGIVDDGEGNLLEKYYTDTDEQGNKIMRTVVNVQTHKRRVYIYNNDYQKTAEQILSDNKEFLQFFKNELMPDVDNAIEYLTMYEKDSTLFQKGAILLVDVFGGDDSISDKLKNLKEYKRKLEEISKMDDYNSAVLEIKNLGFDVVKYKALKLVDEKYTSVAICDSLEHQVKNFRKSLITSVQREYTSEEKQNIYNNILEQEAKAIEEANKISLPRTTLEPSSLRVNKNYSDVVIDRPNLPLPEANKPTEMLLKPMMKSYNLLKNIMGQDSARTIISGILDDENNKTYEDIHNALDNVLYEIQTAMKDEKESLLQGMTVRQLESQYNSLYDSAIGETQTEKAEKYTQKIDKIANGIEFVADLAVTLTGFGVSGALVKGVNILSKCSKSTKLLNMSTKLVSKYEKISKSNTVAKAAMYTADRKLYARITGRPTSFDGSLESFVGNVITNKLKIGFMPLSDKVYGKVSAYSAKLADKANFNKISQKAFTKLNDFVRQNPDTIESAIAGGGASLTQQIAGIGGLGKEEKAILNAYMSEINIYSNDGHKFTVQIGEETYEIEGKANDIYQTILQMQLNQFEIL